MGIDLCSSVSDSRTAHCSARMWGDQAQTALRFAKHAKSSQVLLSNFPLSGECRLSTEGEFEISREPINAPRNARSRWRRFDAMRWFASCYAKPLWWRLGVGVAAALLGAVLRLAFVGLLENRLVYVTF
jgi:hypothetical protein